MDISDYITTNISSIPRNHTSYYFLGFSVDNLGKKFYDKLKLDMPVIGKSQEISNVSLRERIWYSLK